MKHPLKIVMCLLAFAQVGALGQQAETTVSSESRPAGAASPTKVNQGKMTDEEQLIRSAYEKLMRYHKATVLYEFDGKDEDLPTENLLEFELKNFKTGSIDEIKDQLLTDFVPLATGEILDFHIGHQSMNRGPAEAFYRAKWQTARDYGERWFKPKISDLFDLAAAEYFDVGKYTTYEVIVSYQGKSRTYKAAVLLHNLHQSAASPRPEFVDHFVENGALHRVLEEKDPPMKGKGRL